MTWTAQVVAVSKTPDLVSVDIEYTDGQTVFVENYKGTGRLAVEDIVASKINCLEATAAATIITGPITPTVTVQPTAEYLQFKKDLAKLQIVKLLVDMGGVSIDSPRVIALVNQIKTALPNVWDQI